MQPARTESRAAVGRRMCVACGYRGQPIQDAIDRVGFACPACRTDLYARPPRSYAEMEGFAPQSCPQSAPPDDNARLRSTGGVGPGLMLGLSMIAGILGIAAMLTLNL